MVPEKEKLKVKLRRVSLVRGQRKVETQMKINKYTAGGHEQQKLIIKV
jgi:hypothetical protein